MKKILLVILIILVIIIGIITYLANTIEFGHSFI